MCLLLVDSSSTEDVREERREKSKWAVALSRAARLFLQTPEAGIMQTHGGKYWRHKWREFLRSPPRYSRRAFIVYRRLLKRVPQPELKGDRLGVHLKLLHVSPLPREIPPLQRETRLGNPRAREVTPGACFSAFFAQIFPGVKPGILTPWPELPTGSGEFRNGGKLSLPATANYGGKSRTWPP